MKNVKALPSEFLSTDILDEDFVKIFCVYLRLQYFLGSTRVVANDQFVTTPTTYQKFYTLCCITMIIISNVMSVKMYFAKVDGYLYGLSLMTVWACFATNSLIIINARFFNNQENANFFIRLQKLDRLMGIDKEKRLNKILTSINCYSMLTFGTVCILVIIIVGFYGDSVYFTFYGTFIGQFAGLTELIFCSNLIIYFVVRVRFINSIIKNHLARNKVKNNSNHLITLSRKSIRKIALEKHDFSSCDTTAYLKELLDCFALFQGLYRFLFLMFCLKLVVVNLLTFGVILLSILKNIANFLDIFTLTIYSFIDICIAIFLGFRLQIFFEEIKETKRVAIAVMAEYPIGPLRAKARKIIKIIEETPPKLSIYDMWEMDAGIIVTIFSLITTLIVTLLQFMFL